MTNKQQERERKKHYWDLDEYEEDGETELESNLNLLDLPFEVLYEIITHLDSNSLFNLSITSKV